MYHCGAAVPFSLFSLVLPDIRRFHDTAMRSLDEFACGKLAALERAQLRRTPVVTARQGIYAERGGRRLLSFSCNDYLNLSGHPAIIKAAVEAAQRYGVGAGASRLVTGNHPLYDELESRLARLKGADAACVFGSGYLANIGIIPALAGPGDLVLVDELSHACINGGAKLSGATVRHYRHCDVAAAKALLDAHRASHVRALIVTDGVFSMDGDLAPLAALSRLAGQYDAWLLADDAHGLGVVGRGRGSAFANGPADVPLQMGTLSKAVGAYGGYLCASRPVIDLMRTRARSFIYSTGLPPPVVAAAIAALELIEREPDYVAEPLRKARLFTRALNLPEAQSAIVPVIVGETDATLAASQMLEDEGFLVVPIRPPTVPRRHRAAALCLHRATSRRRDRAACRRRAQPRAGTRDVSAIFVTATGTDVGKTFVAASLIRHLRQQGHEVEAIKPVVSGFDPNEAAASDPGMLLDALGLPVTAGRNRTDFAVALSRSAVARSRGQHGRPPHRCRGSRRVLPERGRQRRDVLLIEGVGGIMVPLDDQRTILDVMMALRLPLILVTGSYLGSISHTLTALDSLFTRDMNVMAVIVSETPGSAVPLDEVVATIGRFAEPVIGLPRSGPRAGDPGDGQNLGQLFGAKRDR